MAHLGAASPPPAQQTHISTFIIRFIDGGAVGDDDAQAQHNKANVLRKRVYSGGF